MLTVVIALLVLGVLLLLIEVIFVPGTTIVGIGGVILLGIGVYIAYDSIGEVVGHLSIASALLVIVLSLGVLLKGRTWQRMALDSSITERVTAGAPLHVTVGERGIAESRLNPVGKAAFGENVLEVHSSGGFIDQGTAVEVVRVSGNRILVKVFEDDVRTGVV
jgi:membrane-bound ClpP family serine protease